jgi:hypothetical protein
MTPNLTSPNLNLDTMIRRTPEGMMYWSGTCADTTATCGACAHYVPLNSKRKGCALYRKHIGTAKPLMKETAACKYFEPKP